MCMADTAGISTVPHALIMEKDSLAYITKRVDRIFTKSKMQMLAMEDFCQLDLRLTQDKYKGSYERCAKIIERYSSRKGLDITELYLRLVFSFLVGNSDMHLKNFSSLKPKKEAGNTCFLPPTTCYGQCYHAGGQGAVRPCHEWQKDAYPQEGFPCICREMRHDTELRRKNDCHAYGEKREVPRHVPKLPAAGVFAGTPCKPDRRTGKRVGGLKRSSQDETAILKIAHS